MDSASGGFDEGYSTDIGEEGSDCDMEISPCMTKYWRTICANSFKPLVFINNMLALLVLIVCRAQPERVEMVGRSGEYSTTGRFPLSFGWISGGVLMNFLVGLDLGYLVGFSSCGCGWGGTSACGMDVPSSSGGAFSSCKALSMWPYPKPPDFISASSLFNSNLNVQDLKAGKLLGTVRL
nr:protein FAR1-RELATED SEQUENCE 5-like [Ipomoea batatas]